MPNPASPEQINPRQKILAALNLNRPIEENELTNTFRTLEGYIRIAGRDFTLYIDIIIEFLCLQDLDISKKFFNLMQLENLLTESLINDFIARLSEPHNDVDVSRISEKPSGYLKIFLMEKLIDQNPSAREVIRENLSPFLRSIFLLILNSYFLIYKQKKQTETRTGYINLPESIVEHFLKVAVDYLKQIATRGCSAYIKLFPPVILNIIKWQFGSIVKQNPIKENEYCKKITLADGQPKLISYTQKERVRL